MTEFVNVKFDCSSYTNTYTYKIPDWINPVDLTKDTLIIVPVENSNGLGFAVAKVTTVQSSSKKATKYVVGFVDTQRYRAELVRQAKVAELERNLRERYSRLQQDSWLEELKKRDPESINLIRQLEDLK